MGGVSHQRMGQSKCTYSLTMGYKGQKIEKKAPFSAIFAWLHSLKVLRVVTALTHCKSVRISYSCLRLHLSHKTQDKSDFRPSLWLYPSIFIYSRRPPECSGCLLNQGRSCSRGQDDAVRYEMICFLFIGCHEFSVWPVDSIYVWPCLDLAVGPCALFHILYDVYRSVYSCLLPLLSFMNPTVSFFLSLSASRHWQAGVAFI